MVQKAHILVIVDSLDQRTFWKAIQFRCKFLAKSFYHLGIVDDTKRATSFIGALRPGLKVIPQIHFVGVGLVSRGETSTTVLPRM